MTEWENRGFAPCYHSYTLEIRLTHISSGLSYLFSAESFDSRALIPNVHLTQPIKIRLKNSMLEGSYSVSLRMREGHRFLYLALKSQLLDKDGFYQVSTIYLNSPSIIE